MMGRCLHGGAPGASSAQAAQAHGRGTCRVPPCTGHRPETMRNRLWKEEGRSIIYKAVLLDGFTGFFTSQEGVVFMYTLLLHKI